MWSFWIAFILLMVWLDFLALARLSGKLALLKLVNRFTCRPCHTRERGKASMPSGILMGA